MPAGFSELLFKTETFSGLNIICLKPNSYDCITVIKYGAMVKCSVFLDESVPIFYRTLYKTKLLRASRIVLASRNSILPLRVPSPALYLHKSGQAPSLTFITSTAIFMKIYLPRVMVHMPVVSSVERRGGCAL